MRLLQGMSHFSPIFSKSAKISSKQGSELGADFTPWTPAAHLAHVDLGQCMWRDEAGFVRWLLACGSGWTLQQCTVMIEGDEFLGIAMGCGCFFLVAGRRAWYWRVRLSGLPSSSEANRAVGFPVVSFPSLCNDRYWGGAWESLFMRQSTVAFERISCTSCSRCS